MWIYIHLCYSHKKIQFSGPSEIRRPFFLFTIFVMKLDTDIQGVFLMCSSLKCMYTYIIYILIGEDSQVWCAGHSRLVIDGKYNDALSILTVQHRIILSPTSTGQIILPICLAEVHTRGNTCESSLVIHRLGCVHFFWEGFLYCSCWLFVSGSALRSFLLSICLIPGQAAKTWP